MDVAEFAKVVNAVKQMCASHEDCKDCPLDVSSGGCALMILADKGKVDENERATLERAAMEWLAKENQSERG